MNAGEDRSHSAWWGIGLCSVAMGFVLVFQDPAAGLIPFAVVGVVYALWRLPLRYAALTLLGIALTFENPAERPAEGKWVSFLALPGRWLYDNLNNNTGIKSLRFSVLDVILAALALVVFLRRRDLEKDGGPKAAAVSLFFGVMMATVLALELFGISRGGDFKASLWQVRQLFWLPVVAWIFQATFRGSRDLFRIGAVVLLAAFVKCAVGFYYYQVICRPLNVRPFYLTTHSDSVLFVTAVVMAVVYCLHVRTPSRWLALFTVVPIVGLGIILNNRRLAFVSLAADLALIFLVMPRSRLKRSLFRAALVAVPCVALYMVVGAHSNATFFTPVKMANSLLSNEDRSAETRDIENYNLVHTLQRHPAFGWGFGHEYLELSRADDISQAFALYRYIGHNSVLWLWVIGGLAGFFLIWMVVGLSFYLAARAYSFSRDARDQIGSLVSLSIPLTFAIQAYGDMGLQSWTGLFLLCAELGSMSKLVVELGAWPAAVSRRRSAGLPVCTVPLAAAEGES
jgi:hypothetical protein